MSRLLHRLRDLLARLGGSARPAGMEQRLGEEMAFHLDMQTERNLRAGMPPRDARRAALVAFGGRERFAEAVRDEARHRPLEDFVQDVRYAVRTLRRSPAFTAAAVLTLTLGLGATTVIFSLVDHIVLRPLPYADPDRLVVVREVVGEVRDVYPSLPANASHFLEWRRGCGACEGLAAIKRSAVTLIADGDPQRLGAARVSANLFSLLGVRPALGRGFREEEDRPGQDRVVVLSDAVWRRQFGADPSVVGRAITLNSARFEVIGVLPPTFVLPGGDALGAFAGLPRELDVYRPLALTDHERTAGGEHDFVVLARLRSGATADQARAQLDAIEAVFAERAGGGSTLRAVVVPLHAQVVGTAGRPLLLLLAAVGAVLLIVCVNLANLSLARNTGRQRESAVRVALGAGRGRLARLALAESLVVALAGGGVGLLLAHWGLGALVALAPATLPRVTEVQLDGRVFGAAALLTALVGVIVGALPAIRAGRADPGEALKAGGRTATGSRAATRRRALFIAAQVACSTVLLVGTGLFLTSFVRVLRVDRGFDTDRVLALDVALPGVTYASDARRTQFYERALAELAAVPGVVEVAAASALPLEGETWIDGIVADGDTRAAREQPPANFRFVTPRYFAAVGTPVRRGRTFAESDRERLVAVISERAARTLWPGEDAVGKRLRIGSAKSAAEVVGVAANVRTSTLEQEGSLVVYLPSRVSPPSQGTVVVRTTADPGAVATAVRAALRRVDPSVPVTKVRTMAQVVSATVATRRFQLGLLALFAVMALVTASIGIYGVISQSLASRTGEIGVRMALGARPADIHRLVMGEGLRPVVAGLVVGVAASLALGRVFGSLLFEVRASDPLTLLAVAVLLATVATVACYVPARRATAAGAAAALRLV
ncbi:MAG: ABC transporter permease [Gemmatimonadaceae bacterium]